MRSLKAIPFLYQAKVKPPPLTFDSNISVAQPTVILFVYCLWPVGDTIISMPWPGLDTAGALLYLLFGASSMLLRFDGRPRGAALLSNINDLVSWMENSRSRETSRFWMPSCLRCHPWRIQSFILQISVRFQKTLIHKCFVFADILYRAIIKATSLPHPYLAIDDYNLRTWTGFLLWCYCIPSFNCTHWIHSSKVQCKCHYFFVNPFHYHNTRFVINSPRLLFFKIFVPLEWGDLGPV